MKLLKRIKKFFRKKKVIIKRDPRVLVNTFHAITIEISGEKCPIVNVSKSGIGINPIKESSATKFKVGNILPAVIRMNQNEITINVEVRHNGPGVVGLLIIDTAHAYERYLRQYLYSEFQGVSSKKINSEILKEVERGDPHWYYNDESHELYFIIVENKLTYFQTNFQDYFFQMNFNGERISGKVLDEFNEKITHKGSDIVDVNYKIPQEIYDYVIRYIGAVPNLDATYRQTIQDQIKRKYKINWGEK